MTCFFLSFNVANPLMTMVDIRLILLLSREIHSGYNFAGTELYKNKVLD